MREMCARRCVGGQMCAHVDLEMCGGSDVRTCGLGDVWGVRCAHMWTRRCYGKTVDKTVDTLNVDSPQC